MAKGSLLLVVLLLVPGYRAQTPTGPAIIGSFVQNPTGVLASDTSVTFTCEAMMTDVSWIIGGVRLDGSVSSEEYSIMTHPTDNINSTLSILTTTAKRNENNTEITCVATGTDPNIPDRRTTHILVAAPPLPPFLHLEIFSNGSGLEGEWDSPFSMMGFPITSYTLDVVNKTSGQITKVIMDQDLTRTMTYTLLSQGFAVFCHSLSFSVIATNSVGDSASSNIVTSGFPIFPRTDNIVPQVDVDILSSTIPLLTITFQAPEVCTYQDPAIYTIGIYDDSGDEVILTKEKLANTSIVVEMIEIRLERGQSYSAELTIRHQHALGEAFITFLGIDLPSASDSTITISKGHQLHSTIFTIIVLLIIL